MTPDRPGARRTQAPSKPIPKPHDLTGERLIVQEVYAKLRGYIGISAKHGKDYVHPSQESLTKQLRRQLGWPKLSVRTVMRAIDRLEKLGVVGVQKTQSGNRYTFPENVTSQVTECHFQSDRVSLPTRQSVTSQVTKCHFDIEEINTKEKEYQNNSSNGDGKHAVGNAAADEAPLFEKLDQIEAVRILEAHDYSPVQIKNAIELRGVQFVLELGLHLSERAKLARAGKADRLYNPGGYVYEIVTDPEGRGFRLLDGLWKRPGADRAQAAAKSIRHREEDRARQLAEAVRDAELKAADIEWKARWKAAPQAIRDAVEATVRARGVPEQLVPHKCVDEFRRRTEAGSQEADPK